MTGLEIELNLVDERAEPALKNAEVLEAIADPEFQTELGAVQPRDQRRRRARSGDGGVSGFEDDVRASLNDGRDEGRRGRRPHGDDRHPADARARAT